MSKAKELYEYCVAHPEVIDKLSAMKNEEAVEYVKSLGMKLGDGDIREFMELCVESNDANLAAVVSGGSCSGHCGRKCESECAIDGIQMQSHISRKDEE